MIPCPLSPLGYLRGPLNGWTRSMDPRHTQPWHSTGRSIGARPPPPALLESVLALSMIYRLRWTTGCRLDAESTKIALNSPKIALNSPK